MPSGEDDTGDVLSTTDASARLGERGVELSASELAALARGGKIPGARKGDGQRWELPVAEIDRLGHRWRRRRVRRRLLAAVPVLGLAFAAISALSDGRGLLSDETPDAGGALEMVRVDPAVDRGLVVTGLEASLFNGDDRVVVVESGTLTLRRSSSSGSSCGSNVTSSEVLHLTVRVDGLDHEVEEPSVSAGAAPSSSAEEVPVAVDDGRSARAGTGELRSSSGCGWSDASFTATFPVTVEVPSGEILRIGVDLDADVARRETSTSEYGRGGGDDGSEVGGSITFRTAEGAQIEGELPAGAVEVLVEQVLG